MNTTTQHTATGEQKPRWMRLAVLAVTLGPTIRGALDGLRRGANANTRTLAELAQTRQADVRDARDRLEDWAQESRGYVTEQVQHLRSQARQLKDQSRQLRKALRIETRERQKLLMQARKAGLDLGQDLLKRGEQLTGDLVERGGKVSQDLGKRGRKVSRELAAQGEHLLEKGREHSRAWSVIGFGVGACLAGAITYRIVRSRAAGKDAENESIELSQPASPSANSANSASPARPSGEIRRLDKGEDGTGVADTKRYYPIETQLEQGEGELVHFSTEEEAREQG